MQDLTLDNKASQLFAVLEKTYFGVAVIFIRIGEDDVRIFQQETKEFFLTLEHIKTTYNMNKPISIRWNTKEIENQCISCVGRVLVYGALYDMVDNHFLLMESDYDATDPTSINASITPSDVSVVNIEAEAVETGMTKINSIQLLIDSRKLVELVHPFLFTTQTLRLKTGDDNEMSVEEQDPDYTDPNIGPVTKYQKTEMEDNL